jgi:small subunit ribosomal protein S14
MARKAMILKALEKPKFMTRTVRRCKVCGRARGYLRKFDMCRVCFRKYASDGLIPGVTKSSW